MPSRSPSVFGEIPGRPVGTRFVSRTEVRDAGLHRHIQAGISGAYDQGADAIVVSGGYVDDNDEGDRIVYTGEGGRDANTGRQVEDQSFHNRGNLGLVRSEEQGLPVRVIRGWEGSTEHSPTTGYRYDGLFMVTERWSEPSVDGPIVCRFVLEKIQGGEQFGGQLADAERPPPSGADAPARAVTVQQRIVRNTRVAQWVKEHYDFTCQICGTRLQVGAGGYAEGSHIRPLGTPHDGPDQAGNVLCLCPNDHVLFDAGALYVKNGSVYRTRDHSKVSELRTRANHSPDDEAIRYHRERFAGVK